MSFTKDEIIAALKHESSEKKCIYQKYEPACGLWCELKHIWCVDMSNRSAMNNCQEYSPYSSILKAQATLDLITELLTENENLKDILYDADGVNLVNYWHQQCKIAENGCGNFEKENKNLKAEVERLKTIAKKMHTWIFLNSCDEEKAYAECGLTDEENALLGYCGKIVFENKEMVDETNDE